MAASVIGAFTAVAGEQYAAAAVAALACYGIAGEHAAAVATGPGSYRVALFDAVAALTPEQAVAEARLTVVGG
jgi:hydroxyethylthiazole kinase